MRFALRLLISSLPLIALPALAAQGPLASESVTGINRVGPAAFLFATAAALFLTLLLRRTAGKLLHRMGNRVGRFRMQRALSRQGETHLHDFILPGAFGGLAKIDHALMTPAGLLCIQTKHYSGLIMGEAEDPQWSFIDGSRRQRFLNPMIQNEGRRRALRNVVGDVPVTNLVVFTGNVEFSVPPPDGVIRLADFERYVTRYRNGPSRIDDWDAAWLTLQAAAQTDTDAHKDFQAQIA